MGYKQELLQKIQNIKDFMKARQEDLDGTLQVDKNLKILEDIHQVQGFFNYFNLPGHVKDAFGSEEKRQEFFTKNQALFHGNSMPYISPTRDLNLKIPDVDWEAVITAIEEDTLLDEKALEKLYKDADPKVRAYDLPMTATVNAIKAEADALFEPAVAQELKNSLDFANGEMVQKLGANLVDDAIETNSIIPLIHATEQFKEFVRSKGLDENVVVNHNTGFYCINPGYMNDEAINIYKPFLSMKVEFPQDYQQKIKGLDEAVNQQGLIQQAAGGESGAKEYGLADYFEKQRALKDALIAQTKLQTEDEKRENLIRIDQLAKETKEITDRYEKVLTYIKENFDLDNITLSGNLYGGRPHLVNSEGDLEEWTPNLPPRFDFENAKAVIILNGYTQIKSACQVGEVTLEEYLANPMKTYLKAAENVGKKEDAKYYLPRGEENPLGKRLSRILSYPSEAYGSLKGYNMIGGRGMEFLTNVCPDKESKLNNTIVSNMVREYEVLFNHHPQQLFGDPDKPNIDSIKNLFAFSNQEDDLYKVSTAYRDNEGNPAGKTKEDYEQALKAQAGVPIGEQYRNLMGALKGFALERKYMDEHLEQFASRNKSGEYNELNTHSLGTVLYAGREFFEDYMLANGLTVASIEDDALREEVTSFLTDPVGTLTSKYVNQEELGEENAADVRYNFKQLYIGQRGDSAKDFIQKFNNFNQKPNGYNTGKSFRQCLEDNKGSWWERWRGKTSKQYQILQKIGREAIKDRGNIPGDNKALYSAAKAYREYKLPEGRNFNQLNSTEKRRIEFCDSVINAYEAQQREAQAENQLPQAENNPIQADFQNQLHQDLEPNNNVQHNNVEIQGNPVAEKDPPEDDGVQP